MNCIIVDDEPLAREGMLLLVEKTKNLRLQGSYSNAYAASAALENNDIDLVFLDIQMPGISGIDFAKTIPGKTLVIFTTAYAEYALDSYEVEAVDYLVKPVRPERFQKAVSKAQVYRRLLMADNTGNNIESINNDYFFVKADRKICKVYFKDLLFIEGLKDYVVLYIGEQKIITAMNIKTIYEKLSGSAFVRVSKSYIINADKIDSVDNNTVFIGRHEVPIGSSYRDYFFEQFVTKKLLTR